VALLPGFARGCNVNVYDGAELTANGAKYWLSMDGWSEGETAYLLHAIDPLRLATWANSNGGRLEVNFPLQFDAEKELIARAFKTGVLATHAAPSAVIAWAIKKGLRLPALLIPADAAVKDEFGTTIDYSVESKIQNTQSVTKDTLNELHTHAETPTQQQRRARRYQICIDAGLTMPQNDYSPMPRGVGAIAKQEGITRQAFVEDIKAHIRTL
jgi:hypothetical protein